MAKGTSPKLIETRETGNVRDTCGGGVVTASRNSVNAGADVLSPEWWEKGGRVPELFPLSFGRGKEFASVPH